jgi:SAM-dependent methyltransferase
MPDYRSTYDALAPRWDAWSAAIVPDVREEWARKVSAFVAAGEPVLELGCGTAVPVGRILAETYDYAGVDGSPGMLARAAEALPGAAFECVDMYDVRRAPESLGAVVAFSSISHTPRAKHASLFASIATWLRPGGVFVGNLHSRDDLDGYEPDWLGAGPMSWSGFDAATNARLLEAAGLPVVESAIVDQVEPDGETIRPFWFVARHRA